jgi:hypothetical protein
MQCDNCRFCCWSFNVQDVPDPLKGLDLKPARQHCVYECKQGCSIHGLEKYPEACDGFECPYLEGKFIHRPDNFQDVLEDMDIEVGNFIPAIPPYVPIKIAEGLIRENRSVPAYILIGNEWIKVILSLDREDDKTWVVNERSVQLWGELFKTYGASVDTSVEPRTAMVGYP